MTATEDNINLREYVEGRLDRLAEELANKTGVLRELYDEKHEHIQELMDHRFLAQKEAVEKALTAQKEAVTTALASVESRNAEHAIAHEREHESQKEAVDKSEKRSDEKFEEANNFRKQIEGERLTYARVDMLNVLEANSRMVVEKLDSEVRMRMEKLEADARSRIEKVESDLRQRLEAESRARDDAIRPLQNWQQRSGGQMAVWIGMSGVAIAVVIFLANWATG